MGNKQSGFLARQNQLIDEYSIKVQLTQKQFLIDTLHIAINRSEGYGYDRIMRLDKVWTETRDELFPAIDPRDPLCDVAQEHMQRAFERICKGHQEVIPFKRRYQFVRDVQYDKLTKKAW